MGSWYVMHVVLFVSIFVTVGNYQRALSESFVFGLFTADILVSTDMKEPGMVDVDNFFFPVSVAIGLGAQLAVISAVTISSACLLAAILQMIVGMMVALIEAPCFCAFLEFAQAPGNFFDRKPFWYKALLYGVGGVLPVALCHGVTTFFGGGLVFVAGCIYGIMAMGRKASADEMRARATSTANLVPSSGDVEAPSGDKFTPS